MANARLKLAIFLTYVIFAILLNSVGTVILQSIEKFGVSKLDASTLEGFKDIPIAAASFIVGAFLSRLGYRNGMMVGLILVAIACITMATFGNFGTTQILFATIGVSFALVKVSVYSLVGLLADGPRAHASLLNTIEGIFMIGVLAGYWVFAAFIDRTGSGWLAVYWWLAAIAVLAAILVATTPFDESGGRRSDELSGSPALIAELAAMVRLAKRTLTIAFVVTAFLYVLIEQGIGTWLPTLNREGFGLSATLSVQAASIFAAGLAAGRLGAGLLVQKTGWLRLLIGCVVSMALLLLVVLPLASQASGGEVTSWMDAPMAVFLLPLIGLVMAPIYPTLNSAVLSAIPRSIQPKMVGLIVIFSALGGTSGSLIIGRLFNSMSGVTALYFMLVPIALMAVAILILARMLSQLQQEPGLSL
ncbi:MAG: MFS transporter [Sphingorhabdus sp.]|uniref:MFS transporter n=1 Tax=Sphingorhabdus sp. TaxID=1902408 RepID=UPI003C9ABF2C